MERQKWTTGKTAETLLAEMLKSGRARKKTTGKL